LYRDFSKAKAREFIDLAVPFLKELVNHATHALVRCKGCASLDDALDLPLLALYRQIIELTDAIQVLISECCPAAAIPLIRADFEAFISMEYLLKDDCQYRNRSYAWIVCSFFKDLDIIKLLEPSSQEGIAFQTVLANDSVFSRITLPDQQMVTNNKEFVENILFNDPNLKDTVDEYKSMINPRTKKGPNWYSLYQGPKSIYEMARNLDRAAWYKLIYSQWSAFCHAADARSFMKENFIRPIRTLDEMKYVTVITFALIMGATRHVIGKIRPGESFEIWMTREKIDERAKRILSWGR